MKVSIIVPIYNVEKYLHRCVDSILAQTYKNIEIILVDDGSTDSSGQIADEYKKNHPEIIVVHKENGGVSDTRNHGMDNATGQYICFADSDDWLEPDAIEEFVNSISSNNADLAMSAYYTDFVCDNYSVEHNIACEKIFYSESQIADAIYEMEKISLNVLWNKIYVTEIIKSNHLKFLTELNTGEDLVFNCHYLRHVKQIALCPKKTYHYIRQGEISLAGKYQKNLYAQSQLCNQTRKALYDLFGMNSEKYKEMYAKTFIGYIFSCIPNLYKKQCSMTRTEKKAELKKILNTPLLKENLDAIKQKTGYQKLMFLLYKLRNTCFAIAITDILFFIRYNLKSVYQRIRKNLNKR